jgi:hypothetical protein
MGFEQRTFYVGSLRAKLILAPLGMLNYMQNNQCLTKKHVVLKEIFITGII